MQPLALCAACQVKYIKTRQRKRWKLLAGTTTPPKRNRLKRKYAAKRKVAAKSASKKQAFDDFELPFVYCIICHTTRERQWEILHTPATGWSTNQFAWHTSFYSLKGVLHSYWKAAQKVTNFRQLCVLQVKSVGRQSNFDALNDLVFALSSATCECYPWQLQLVSWYIDRLVAWSIAFPIALLPSFTISQLPWLCRYSRVG